MSGHARKRAAGKLAARLKRKPLQRVAATTEKGGLHRSLGIPLGQKIGAARIEAATHSSDPKTRKEAVLAQTYARARR